MKWLKSYKNSFFFAFYLVFCYTRSKEKLREFHFVVLAKQKMYIILAEANKLGICQREIHLLTFNLNETFSFFRLYPGESHIHHVKRWTDIINERYLTRPPIFFFFISCCVLDMYSEFTIFIGILEKWIKASQLKNWAWGCELFHYDAANQWNPNQIVRA